MGWAAAELAAPPVEGLNDPPLLGELLEEEEYEDAADEEGLE